MSGKNSVEVPQQEAANVLQHLSLADWRMVDRLPVSAGEMTLSRLLHHGWIESRGEKQRAAVRLTPPGGAQGDAVADWKAICRLVELRLKAKK
jgi:hypothetical protein